MSNRAWVTLATNDSYGLGALVLAHSLRRAGSAYPSVVLITPSVTEAMRERLRAVFAEVVTVDVLDSRDAAHLALLQRPELGITFTKIHCWNLTQYEKCVFLDADILVVQNCDELFEREELSAAPDVGWPDCFNSGVFVFTPSTETFNQLIAFARERGSFDGGDQGLLNSFFSDWARGDINKHLPFLYNVTSAAFYSYLPALKHYGQNLKVIHFIGAAKPWLQHFNWDSSTVDAPEHLREFLQLWWDLFVAQVHSQLDTSMSGVAGNLARVVPGSVSQGEALDELTRRQGWEAGNIDYMGADSFANIWAKISQTLSQPRTSPAKSPPRESTPSKSAPMEDKPAEAILETTTESVEIAKEATEATTLAEVLAQTEVVAPLETPAVSTTAKEAAAKTEGTAPVDAATPGEVAVPVQAAASIEDAASVETAASVEPDTPVKTTTVVEPATPVEIPAPAETTAPVETVAPVKTIAPVENAAPVETSMPAVVPVKVDSPIEVAASVEAVTPIEAPTSIEAPVPVEASIELKSTTEASVTETVKESTVKVTSDIPLTAEAAAPSMTEIVETSAAITTPAEAPVTVEASEKVQVIPTTEAPVQIPVEALQKTECIVPVASAPVAAKAPQAPSDIPEPVEIAAEIPVPVETAPEAKKTESAETPAVQSEAVIVSDIVAKALKPVDSVEACPASPAVAAEAPEPALEATPPKAQSAPASDSPPLAHTPSKEEAPAVPAAKSEERRKPAGKLQLSPPAAPDPLPTPDSEAEDAAALAHSIIASELQAAATPTPPTPIDRLTVEEPEVPTPPVGAVSLAQIGVKPVKGKPTIAAQIESSVAEKDDGAATTPALAQATTAESPKEAPKVAPKDAPKEAPKKKVMKKVVKKDSGASGAGGDAPVPPPRKKEKKPKEK